ncbi:MAG: class I SAM-dependent methyltransferase [Kiritimatiellia bacterium]|nr:class I SAM-dependent methyltransferase [Kiritimatiellia bacterium]
MSPMWAQKAVFQYWIESANRSYNWAGTRVADLCPKRLLDVGCGDGSRLLEYIQSPPDTFCGIEGNPVLMKKAQERGIQVQAFDLNQRWPYADASFDVLHSSQVIEHVHNTRLFASEALRVLAPGGVAIVTSENLTSWLNTTALILGYTPFSLQQTCGWYLGNPFGLHSGEEIDIDLHSVSQQDPAFSGISGHNRVLGARQAYELFCRVGFSNVEIQTVGLMPMPGILGRRLERVFRYRGHWLLVAARKAVE